MHGKVHSAFGHPFAVELDPKLDGLNGIGIVDGSWQLMSLIERLSIQKPVPFFFCVRRGHEDSCLWAVRNVSMDLSDRAYYLAVRSITQTHMYQDRDDMPAMN